MDLLEDMSKKEAHLTVQDVLSIFFQVLLMPQRFSYASFCHMADTSAIHGIASDPLSDTLCLKSSLQADSISLLCCRIVCRASDGLHVSQVCCAVQAMHQQQPPLAHRDLKPHNVLVRRDQPDVETARRDASSASPSSQQAEELKGNGEAEPLQTSHSGQTRRYHAVLMVRHSEICWPLQCCKAVTG